MKETSLNGYLVEQIENGTPTLNRQARQLLLFSQLLNAVGLPIRWPKPPLNHDFFLLLFEEYNFQLNWNIKSFEMRLDLSSEERESDFDLSLPFTEEGVTRLVAFHRTRLDERLFITRALELGNLLPEEENRYEMLQALKTVSQSSFKEGSDRYLYREAEPTGIWKEGLDDALTEWRAIVEYHEQLKEMSDQSYRDIRSSRVVRN